MTKLGEQSNEEKDCCAANLSREDLQLQQRKADSNAWMRNTETGGAGYRVSAKEMESVMDWICCDCGAAFNESEARTQTLVTPTERGGKIESYPFCPECGSDNLERASYCCRCGKPYLYKELRGGYYCDSCLIEMQDPYHMRWFIREELDAFAEFMHEQREKGGADNDKDCEA